MTGLSLLFGFPSPPRRVTCRKGLQLPCLWSQEDAPQAAAVSEAASQLRGRAAGAQAAGTLTMVFQNVMGLRGLSLLRKHEGNTNS